MKIRNLLLANLFIIFSLVSAQVFSQAQATPRFFDSEKLDAIDKKVIKTMKENRVPGASVALIESGKIVLIKGYGVANNRGTKVTVKTPFQLASLTKSFTALLMLKLESEGELSLKDPITKHIPWFATSKERQADKITIRNLLQHSSGLPRLTGNLTQNTTYRGADATKLSVNKLLYTELLFEPGTHFEYSNANYHIASHIVELVTKKSFEEVMTSKVLKPLKMHNSYVQVPLDASEPEAIGFPQWFGIPIERKFILGRMKMGDGGMVASAEDLSAYLLAISKPDNDVVSTTIRDNLLNTENSNAHFGLGWSVSSLNGAPLYEHDGGNGGFSTWFGFSESTSERADIGVIILSNSSSSLYDRFVYDLKLFILKNESSAVKANTMNLIFLIYLYLGIIVLAFSLFRAIVKPAPKFFRLRLLIMPCALISLAYFTAIVVPKIFDITLFGIYPFFPDLMVGLTGFSTLALTLAFIKIIKILANLLLLAENRSANHTSSR